MRAHLGRELPDERWLRTIGMPLRDPLQAFAWDAEEARAMLETYARFQRRVHDEMVRPFPGARRTLQELGEAGVAVAVVTSKRGEMALGTIECCHLADLVHVLVSADDVVRGKPDPEPVLAALDRLDLRGERERVLFVGDAPYDIRAGKAAGIRTAAALWGSFPRAVLEGEGPDWARRCGWSYRSWTGRPPAEGPAACGGTAPWSTLLYILVLTW